MWNQIADLFSGNGLIPMIIILAGVVLCFIEVFIPGFGVFGIVGIILTTLGIVIRMIMGASLEQFLIMILLAVSLIVLAIIIMLLSAKIGLIKHSSLIETKTSVSTNYGADNKLLLKMLGKVTFAITDFKPVGKFYYNDEVYVASTYGEYVAKGDKIVIVEIQADKIFVKKSNSLNGKTK